MRVVVFGATGMVGAGVLLECLDAPSIEQVLLVGRSANGVRHPKVREVLHADFTDFSALYSEFAGLDAAFYCLGATSNGLDEAQYRRVTLDFTVAAATALHAASPGLVFCFVSGRGSDSSEQGRVMWARVKGAAENAILGMGFRDAYIFRPGVIQPLRGVRSRTALYQRFYDLLGFMMPLFWRLMPGMMTSTVAIGRAMINVSTAGYPKQVLESPDINRAAERRQEH